MKKLIALALVFVFVLSACSNWSVEIKDPQSDVESSESGSSALEPEQSGSEPEQSTSGSEQGEKTELTKEQKQLIAESLNKLAAEYNEGSVFLPSGLAFPEEIMPDDFTAENYSQNVFRVYVPLGGDTVIAVYEVKDGEALFHTVYAQSDIDNPADHSGYKTGYGETYENEELGFKVQFSEKWTDNYTPEVEENVSLLEGISGTEVKFYYKDTRNADDPYSIYNWEPLCVIYIVSSDDAEKMDSMEFTGMNKAGASKDGMAYYYAVANGFPSGCISSADMDLISKMGRGLDITVLS